LHALITGSTPYYGHTDGLGNVIALTDGGQRLRRTYAYDAWGQLVGGADSGGFAGRDRARWKGALWLGPEVELYYMRQRWYGPKEGRFWSEDPLGLCGWVYFRFEFPNPGPLGQAGVQSVLEQGLR